MHWRHLSRLATSEVRIGIASRCVGRLDVALARVVYCACGGGFPSAAAGISRASTEIGRNVRALHRSGGAPRSTGRVAGSPIVGADSCPVPTRKRRALRRGPKPYIALYRDWIIPTPCKLQASHSHDPIAHDRRTAIGQRSGHTGRTGVVAGRNDQARSLSDLNE